MTIERGPNLNLLDLVASPRQTPLFSSWRNPVPPEWFSTNRGAYTLVDQEALYGSLKFSTFYGRTGAEALSTPTDIVATTGRGYARGKTEVPAIPVDSAVSTRNFFRTGSESTAVPVDVVAGVRNSGALVNSMIDEYP